MSDEIAHDITATVLTPWDSEHQPYQYTVIRNTLLINYPSADTMHVHRTLPRVLAEIYANDAVLQDLNVVYCDIDYSYGMALVIDRQFIGSYPLQATCEHQAIHEAAVASICLRSKKENL